MLHNVITYKPNCWLDLQCINLNFNKRINQCKTKTLKAQCYSPLLSDSWNTNKVLVMSSYEQEMKLVKGDLERVMKVNEGPKFKCAKVATTQWWRWGKWWHVMALRQELANWQWMSIVVLNLVISFVATINFRWMFF
jgi:hypothetical protein